MEKLSKYTNIGDSLSSINFNFTCLDIKLCNIQHDVVNKFSKIQLSNNWDEGFYETLAMSANWQSVKETVHNTSAWWDAGAGTIFYKEPFRGGRVSKSTILKWLKTTYPAVEYSEGYKMIVYWFSYHKHWSLHRPPNKSVKRFGKLSTTNNVYIKNLGAFYFTISNGDWVETTEAQTFPDLPCILQENCQSCWGTARYADYTFDCVPQPTTYMLSCDGDDVVVDDPVVDIDPCTLFDTITAHWDYDPIVSTLENDPSFQIISASQLTPYIIGEDLTINPEVEVASGGDGEVYDYYINNNLAPIFRDLPVERVFALNTKDRYSYNYPTNTFTNTSSHSSTTLNFSTSADSSLGSPFTNADLENYMESIELAGTLTLAASSCPFDIEIITSWYRWVIHTTALSGTPYWHIGLSANNPSSGIPDDPADWAAAYATYGSTLSSYFGTNDDLMGRVYDVDLIFTS